MECADPEADSTCRIPTSSRMPGSLFDDVPDRRDRQGAGGAAARTVAFRCGRVRLSGGLRRRREQQFEMVACPRNHRDYALGPAALSLRRLAHAENAREDAVGI